MDPYVILEVNGRKYKTSVVPEGGRKPVWNQTFEIPILSMEDDIKITCFDEDLILDDLVGFSYFKTRMFCTPQPNKEWISLQYKENRAAELLIETLFERSNYLNPSLLDCQ